MGAGSHTESPQVHAASSDLRTKLADVLQAPELEPATIRGTQAAVLVPLFERAGQLHAVLTLRREDLTNHAGEVSFPGGRRDHGESLVETALRESHEEIGLQPQNVEVVGMLPPISTFVTNYAVHPYVGLVPADSSWNPSDAEVARVAELPLAELAATCKRRVLVRRGVPIPATIYGLDGLMIWGATARILGELFERLRLIT